MARSSSSPPPPAPPRAGWIWPAVPALVVILGVAPLMPLADVHLLAAAGFAVTAVLTVVCTEMLRRQHRRTEERAAHYEDQLRVREAEIIQRDNRWRSFSENEAERVRLEIEHTVKERLPAVLRKEKAPGALHDDLPISARLDELLQAVVEGVEYREESQRLALVELANRVQTSAHRIQASVTSLANRYPGDADLLEVTMETDHAATQQARHAQSLKVLCGEFPGQQWQRPLALVDVVRAASGRIVAYRRVEVTGDPDVGVTAVIVEPLIHLIAELLANATEYSPPKTGVPVTVRTVQRGAVIEVDDGGLGLDEYRLSEAREIVSGRRLLGVGDVGEIPQTGFAVAGRFARRHGFHVDVGPSPYGGVRAVVLVPSEALETVAPIGVPARRGSAAPPPAPSRTPLPPAARQSLPAERVPDPAAFGTDTVSADRAATPDGGPAPGAPTAGGAGSGTIPPVETGTEWADPAGQVPHGAQEPPTAPADPAGHWAFPLDDASPTSGPGDPALDAGETSGYAGHPAPDAAAAGYSAPEAPAAGHPATGAPGPEPVVGGRHAAPAAPSAAPPAAPPAAEEAREEAQEGAGAQDRSTPLSEGPGRRGARRLPRRQSRRHEYDPSASAPAAPATPPGTPEEAGDWMDAFFAGGRGDEYGSPQPLTPEGDMTSPTTPDPSEGQT